MHEAGVQDAPRHLLARHYARLSVEREHVEHLHQLPRCPLVQEPMYVLRPTDVDRLRLRPVRLSHEPHPCWLELRASRLWPSEVFAAPGTAPYCHALI